MNLKIKLIHSKFKDMNKIDKLAIEAFPREEYLAPAKIIELASHGEIDFLALYDSETFVGFMVVKLHKNMAYLFFLAIDPSLRSSGYGSKALSILREKYKEYQFVLDLETIDETALNYEQRKIRKAFYCRNGFEETGQFLTYGGCRLRSTVYE